MIELKINVDTPQELLATILTLSQGLLVGTSQGAIVAADQSRGHTATEAEDAHLAVQAQISGEPIEGDKPKRTRRTKEQIAADEAAAAALAQAGNDASGAGEVTELSAAETASDAPSGVGDAPAALDFDKDVAPTVLKLVRERGKPWVSAVLEQFGIQRASELPAERWGELLTALNDADAV